jgi:multidrug efflux pump subunit AcrB
VPEAPDATTAGRRPVFFFGSFALVPLLPTGFIPPDDLSQTQVYVSLPPGSTFKRDARRRRAGARHRERNPHVKMVYTAGRRRRRRQRPLHARAAPPRCARRR